MVTQPYQGVFAYVNFLLSIKSEQEFYNKLPNSTDTRKSCGTLAVQPKKAIHLQINIHPILKVTVKVLVDQTEFEEACTNGYVYGWVQQYVDNKMQRFSVFVRLGQEGKYREKPTDNPKTSYKIFFNCTIRYAQNDEDCDNRKFFLTEAGQTVITFC